jgi:multidrug efflux pump subunit AcrB
MVVDVNQEQAKHAGLSTQDIALSLQTQISGLTATQFREGDNLVPVVLRARRAFGRTWATSRGSTSMPLKTAKACPCSNWPPPV